MKKEILIATRESPLALWQANWVKERLLSIYPDRSVRLIGMTTEADRLLETPLVQMGGKGVFVKELEEALLDNRADIAVHSMKDVPMILPEGLCIPVMCERFDPRDAFVSNHVKTLSNLPSGSIVGTSSLRRQSQILALYPDLALANLRGNVGTRLAKLDRDEFAAIILAAAGLKRLGLENRISSYLSLEESLPAAGQGVLGIECRENDNDTKEIIAALNHPETFVSVSAERAMCTRLGGGCQVPVAAYAEIKQGKLELRGLVAAVNGKTILRAHRVASVDHPEALGIAVSEELLQLGAGEILNAL